MFWGNLKVETVRIYLCIVYHVACVSVYLTSIISVTGRRSVQNAGFKTGEAMTRDDFYLEILARREDVPLFDFSVVWFFGGFGLFFHYFNFQSNYFVCHVKNCCHQTMVIAQCVGTIGMKIWLSLRSRGAGEASEGHGEL